jgi:hypothetical protein
VRARGPRRRLRLRRKRKGESFSKAFDAPDVVDVADAADGLNVDVGDVTEVVGHMGCCVVEAVGSMAVLLALLTVPAYFLMHWV